MLLISFNKPNFSRKSSPENLFISMIIVAGLVVGYLLYSRAPVSIPEFPPLKPYQDEAMASRIRNTKFDFSVFDSVIFRQLKIFGEIPVVAGPLGRDNPFAPVSSR